MYSIVQWPLLAGLACCGLLLGARESGSARELHVEPLATPSPVGLWPRVAVDGERAEVAWTAPIETGAGREGPQTLHVASFDARETLDWTEPRTIATGAPWFVNWADFPALAIGADATRAATWLASVGGGYAYHVQYALSADGGATWSAGRRLHDDDSGTEHGFVSLVPLGGEQGFAAVWLDGREMQSESDNEQAGGHGHGHGSMTLRTRTIAPDGQCGREALLDARVCECCQTDAALLGDGTLVIAYRDRSDEELRDIGIVRGRPGNESDAGMWSEPVIAVEDRWSIGGCPVNGPALDAHDQQLALAWFTMGPGPDREPGELGVPRQRIAFSADGGLTFDEPLALGAEGAAAGGRVDVVFLDANTAIASWLEAGSEPAWFAALCSRSDSTGWSADQPVRVAPAPGDRAAGFLRLGRLDDGRALAAWTNVGRSGPGGIETALFVVE